MQDKPQEVIAFIKALTAAEQQLVYEKLTEALHDKLLDLLKAGDLTPAWLDS